MAAELTELHRIAAQCDEGTWHEAILASASDADHTLDGVALPGFPSEAIQLAANGRPAAKSLVQAFQLYTNAMQVYRDYGPDRADTSFLDFGAGWGRIWRYFVRNFDPDRMFAYDVNPKMPPFWGSEMLGASFVMGRAYDPLPYADDTFDLVVSNSVFSHLSNRLNLFTAREISRVMHPGGIFIGTTFGAKHLRRWKNFSRRDPDSLSRQQLLFASMTDDFDAVIDAYDNGEFVWLEPNRLRAAEHLVDYEVSAFNANWIHANWSEFFEVISFDDVDAGQAVFVLQKPHRA